MEEVYPQKNKKVTTSEKKVVTWEENPFAVRFFLCRMNHNIENETVAMKIPEQK